MPAESEFRIIYSSGVAKRVLVTLLGFEALLISGYCIMHIVAPGPHWGPLAVFINVDREVSMPTWFSSVQLVAVGFLLLVKARESNELQHFLILVGLGFIFLSVDESAAIHEKLVDSARRSSVRWLSDWSYVVWTVAYLAIGLLIVLVGYRPLSVIWRKYRREAIWIAGGTTIFVIGGMGFEVLSRLLYTADINWRFLVAVAAEEFFEMAGVSLILYGTMLLGIRIQSDH